MGMAAGDSASRRAQEARRQERLLREQWQAARRRAARWEAASEGERLVAAQLLMLGGRGWRLLMDRMWPGTRAANVDMLLIGPGGAYVIDVKNWARAPEGPDDPRLARETAKLLAVTRATEQAVTALGMSPVAVHPVMVFAGHRVTATAGRVRLFGESEVGRALAAERHRLSAAMVRAVADHLADVFPEYGQPATEPARADRPSASSSPAAVADGMFEPETLHEATLEAARQGPIEQWMTFLHPEQVALVRRDWAGPARISGPAGTGKTVVGLHRVAHLARRVPGRILYVTFANNLPRVQATFLRTMSPAIADRVDFHSLHGWAQTYLRDRGVTTRLSREKAETAFSLAWTRTGRPGPLGDLGPGSHYWREEIDCVIKGRGITTLAQYLAVARRGRARLARAQREAVWELFQEYERLRAERGVHDFNDILSIALHQATTSRDPSPYDAVIADEVQDLTLVGVRLLHALVGDRRNGLLLVGDGQQAVYPGGFRLSDAGIDIRGDRGQVLRTNYRNTREIIEAGLALVADHPFDDIDGVPSSGRRDIELVHHGGEVVRVAHPTREEHDRALIDALTARAAAAGWGDTAVLCPFRRAIGHYQRLLTRQGIPVCPLDQYDGNPVNAVKLGSYRKAKGLEFKHVFLPEHDATLDPPDATEELARERGELALRQLYVAITRARDTLWLGRVAPAAEDHA
ncbi:nuclease-related domain-containing DEAD/DEAH box helicase [Streptomyces mayteni]